MIPSFPEEDFSFRPEYIRVLDGISGDHCICLVNEQWYQTLIKQNRRCLTLNEPQPHPFLSNVEIRLLLNQQSSPQIQHPWTRLELFRLKLSPTTRISRIQRVLHLETSNDLLEDLVELLQNKIQLLAFQKRHSKSIQGILHEDESSDSVVESADIVRLLCESVLHCPFLDFSGQPTTVPFPKAALNILPPVFVAALVDHFVIALPFRPYTLASCLRFSPSLLSCDAAKYFILYQILQAISRFQEHDFFTGNISLEDFVIREDLWVGLKPIAVFKDLAKLVHENGDNLDTKDINMELADDSSDDVCKISEWTTLWCLGKISNYDYILALNNAAGRTFGHPDNHPIFPWVVDFTSQDGGWRDLTKSKYRLTKGDRQLELTYDAVENDMVAHHIPETFSDLTFYIYNARKVPKTLLCQHVRKRWVPAEYPSTLERLYKWSPDECIPEFYSDPEIFISIHDDLPDLGLPDWCETIDQFLDYHRAALESDYVTSNLHHWINLNFGYKLSGEAAILAKNVVLSRQIPQRHLKNHGIQQLFTLPHPPVLRTSSWYDRNMPQLYPRKSTKKKDQSGDNISVSSLELGDDVIAETEGEASFRKEEPTEMGPIFELESLESLIDFCLAVDGDQPAVLKDFLPSTTSQTMVCAAFLRNDLQAIACLAIQIFSIDRGSANWPEIADLKERMLYCSKQMITWQGSLASALRDLLNGGVFPYSASQILSRQDHILPIPDYISSLYQFVCNLDTRGYIDNFSGNLNLLEDVMEEISTADLDIIATFIRQRLEFAPDRNKFAVLFLDPIVKYFGPAKSAEIFLPSLHRLYSDFPSSTSPEYSAYLQLFEVDFLRAMLIRFGGEIFMRSVIVPLIEKLTDVQEWVSSRVDFALGDGFVEDIFSVDVEEKRNDLAMLKNYSDSPQSQTLLLLLWLAEKVGPLLTARFISGNLLKSLALCYVEDEKLKSMEMEVEGQEEFIQKLIVVGDVAAWVVSDALLQIASLFGNCFIWDQYFSYCSELVKDALRRLTPMNEAGLLGCMELMQHIIPHVDDPTLMEHLPFQLINEILYPVVELVTSFSHVFPAGAATRKLLTVKWLNLVFSLASRIGRESAQKFITHPLLVTFFGIFTQLYGTQADQRSTGIAVPKTPSKDISSLMVKESNDIPFGSPFISIRKDTESGELTVGTPVRISSVDSLPSSPTPPFNSRNTYDSGDCEEAKAELKAVFTEQLAFDSYVPFCRLLGQHHLDDNLLNSDLLHEISISNPKYIRETPSQSLQIPQSQLAKSGFGRSQSGKFDSASDAADGCGMSRSLIPVGSYASLGLIPSTSESAPLDEEGAFFSARESGYDRILRGNWLAYWQHELGQGRRDEAWNIKQIPLQTFSAHAGPVKSISILDCEYSFMTASKDKTVRLWSIRNSGDGSTVSQAEGHYLDHKRPVSELRFLGRERLAASCDGTVNLWDPWTVTTISRIEVVSQATFIDCSPAPSSVLFVGHLNEETCFVSRFDVRSRIGPAGTGQFQVSPNSPGVLRCLVVSPDDAWFACGFSSGVISVFDQRTGIMSATWKQYESDVVQLIPVSSSILASIGSDNVVFLWDLKREVDDRMIGSVRGFTEPIVYAAFAPRSSGGDLITLMANNRVGVVADVLRDGTTITSTKIRHDSMKGNFSTLSVLPLNRQLLIGNDNGSTLLMC